MLFAEFTAIAFVELTSETLFHQIMEAVAKRFELHVVDDLIDEGILEQEFGLLKRDATLTHIEEGRIVELTYRLAMGTLHIVGIDLEHRLGVHPCHLGSRQALDGHLRRGLLGAMFHQHTTSKGTSSLIVEHVFIKLV